jgi:hypothetical protein
MENGVMMPCVDARTFSLPAVCSTRPIISASRTWKCFSSALRRQGPCRGIWQTDRRPLHGEPALPSGLPVRTRRMDAKRQWNDPDKYVTVIFHWDGYDDFRLTHRGPPKRTYNVSGRALITLHKTPSGALSPFPHACSNSALKPRAGPLFR